MSQRRCILLAIIGATNTSSTPLKIILEAGFLIVVKSWLDDTLQKAVGGADLLLHMLTNITYLPLNKEMVSSSKLGKAVVGIAKQKICSGGKNEVVIKERIAKLKEEWSASVKRVKASDVRSSMSPAKRQRENLTASTSSSPGAKKAKTLNTSDLIRKTEITNVQLTSGTSALMADKGEKPLSAAGAARLKSQERAAKEKARLATLDVSNSKKNDEKSFSLPTVEDPRKKRGKQISWSDTKNGILNTYCDVKLSEEEQKEVDDSKIDGISVKLEPWSDRKKRDRTKENDLLEQARKTEMADKQAKLDNMGKNPPLVEWKPPASLDLVPSVQVVISNEKSAQNSRMVSATGTRYISDEDVPSDPTQLSDIEQALEMTAQVSAVVAEIPFFTPQQSTLSTAPVQQQVQGGTSLPLLTPNAASNGMPPDSLSGLPNFLQGSNAQALQTLASNPSLLNTFMNPNGSYDQSGLTNLVQTLTQNLNAGQNLPQHNFNQPFVAGNQGVGNAFQNLALANLYQHVNPNFSAQQQPSSTFSNVQHQSADQGRQHGKGGGYRGEQNGEGNLHVSGYGPHTTRDEIHATFSPYVQVQEVVTKGTFSFVNTMDPLGARRAMEALNGTFIGGRPIRINYATRKAPDRESKGPKRDGNIHRENPPLPVGPMGQIDYDNVRDDRGNLATKNLFVAGYGHGTTEQQLREVFSQHCQVTGTVMKGNFSFVNTADRKSSVIAREGLTGAVINGGVLRINFAKESGRLGTSFDATYNKNTYGPAQSMTIFNGASRY